MSENWALNLAQVGRAVGDRSRAAFLTALMDGRAWTVTELAAVVNISKSTASEHVAVLEGAGLVERVAQGRHRYVRLAGSAAADLVESMVSLGSIEVPQFPKSLAGQRHQRELVAGRTCYRHPAGKLGVALTRSLKRAGFLSCEWTLTDQGHGWVEALGIEIPERPQRPLCRPCLDWTERVDHLAGLVADGLVSKGLHEGWFVRSSHPRSLRLTSEGYAVLRESGLTELSIG